MSRRKNTQRPTAPHSAATAGRQPESVAVHKDASNDRRHAGSGDDHPARGRRCEGPGSSAEIRTLRSWRIDTMIIEASMDSFEQSAEETGVRPLETTNRLSTVMTMAASPATGAPGAGANWPGRAQMAAVRARRTDRPSGEPCPNQMLRAPSAEPCASVSAQCPLAWRISARTGEEVQWITGEHRRQQASARLSRSAMLS